jgi:hypothetical protein
MTPEEQQKFCESLCDHLLVPKELIPEVFELYAQFDKAERRCLAHFDQDNVLKCVLLFVARKNDIYILSGEILLQPNGSLTSKDTSYRINKEIHSVYRKLKEHLNNPDYMKFSTGKYLDRLCNLLDLSHQDIDCVLNSLADNETPVSILRKMKEQLDLDFDEIVKAKPNVSPSIFGEYKSKK